MEHLIIKPIPVPKTGPIQKLKLEVAPNCADIYIEQTQWPRQKSNPKWRIEVTNIDARYDAETHIRIREACEQIAKANLEHWLQYVAPLLTVETATWQELVRFATERPRKIMSPYQQRRKRRSIRLKKLFPSGINIPDKTTRNFEKVDDLSSNTNTDGLP